MENEVNKIRIKSFDLLKIFAIYLVIWGHCVMWFLSSESSENMVFRVVNSFHVSLFMMISGYFAISSTRLVPMKFLIKKLKQLIYPCFVWGLLYLIFFYFISLYQNGFFDFNIKQLLEDLYWFSDFWFLKSCFVCYCLLYTGSHLGLKTTYWILLTLLVSQFISSFFVSFMYPCFILGYLIKESQSLRIIIKRHTFLICFCFFVMLLFWNKVAWDNSHGISIDILHSGFLNILSIAFFRLYRLIIGIIGALSFFALAIHIPNNKIHSNLLCNVVYWGGYTLEIYILQCLILERILSHYINYDDMNIYMFNIVISPILSLLILILCILIIRFILKSNKLMTILFGR